MMLYPLLAAKKSKYVEQVWVSTDSPRMKQIAKDNRAEVIDRPAHLATKEALSEDVFCHAYEHIRQATGKTPELLVLLMANAPIIRTETINEGIEVLRKDAGLDSAVSVSCYNMYSPLRARRIIEDGTLQPFVSLELIGDPARFSSDRNSQGDAWFADMGVSVVRPRCLEDVANGLLPQRWMGKRIYPLRQWGGLDVDFKWQVPYVEDWLREHGVTEARESDDS